MISPSEHTHPDLAAFVARCTVLSPAQLDQLFAAMEPRTMPKRTLLLRAGDVCDFEAYVHRGCVRSYCIDANGHEVTLQFATEGWWASDIASFNERVPSRMFIETLEETELLVLKYDRKERLYQEIPALERMFRLMVQRNLSNLQDRFVSTLARPADERYEAFLLRFPELPNRVPQHLIASYLGITPEFLSKLRTRRLGRG
jgi:CRP-like cAMP-binding protein